VSVRAVLTDNANNYVVSADFATASRRSALGTADQTALPLRRTGK
jgi:hypothetical protein